MVLEGTCVWNLSVQQSASSSLENSARVGMELLLQVKGQPHLIMATPGNALVAKWRSLKRRFSSEIIIHESEDVRVGSLWSR